MDTEQDILAAVTGEPTDKSLGKWISGKDSLTIKAAVSLETLPALLERIHEKYNDDSYKTNFALVAIADVLSPTNTVYAFGPDMVQRYGEAHGSALEIYQRKPSPPITSSTMKIPDK